MTIRAHVLKPHVKALLDFAVLLSRRLSDVRKFRRACHCEVRRSFEDGLRHLRGAASSQNVLAVLPRKRAALDMLGRRLLYQFDVSRRLGWLFGPNRCAVRILVLSY